MWYYLSIERSRRNNFQLREVIFNQVNVSPKEIDILQWMSRTALELIGQSGMGYSFDSLDSSEAADQHPYSRSVNRLGWVHISV